MLEVKKGRYRHYKGKEYRVIGNGFDSENLTRVVIYQAEYDSKEFGKKPIWVRKAKEFLESVSVNGKNVPRFELIEEENSKA